MWRNRIQLLLATPAVFIHFKLYSTFSWIASFMAFKNAKKCLILLFPSNYQLFLHQFISFAPAKWVRLCAAQAQQFTVYKYCTWFFHQPSPYSVLKKCWVIRIQLDLDQWKLCVWTTWGEPDELEVAELGRFVRQPAALQDLCLSLLVDQPLVKRVEHPTRHMRSTRHGTELLLRRCSMHEYRLWRT